MPSDKSKRDPDQKLNPPRPFSSPGFAKVMQSIADQLLDQLHAQQNFVAELEQAPDRKKAAHPISQRSLDPDPRTADVKRPAPVVEIKKSATMNDTASQREAASSSAGAVDEDESTAEHRRRTQQIGDRAVSSLPPRSGSPVQGEEVRHTPVSIIERIRSSKKKPLYLVIEMFKAEHPGESDTKAILKGVDGMITDIGSEGEQKRVRKDVHESVPSRWQERIGVQTSLVAYWDKSDPKERGRIKTYVSDVKVIQ